MVRENFIERSVRFRVRTAHVPERLQCVRHAKREVRLATLYQPAERCPHVVVFDLELSSQVTPQCRRHVPTGPVELADTEEMRGMSAGEIINLAAALELLVSKLAQCLEHAIARTTLDLLQLYE